ncbi:MAG: GxGYxYP family putative glycoside hydrolase [Candidatus Sumerlaeia bacterium]|nr:GxGYxYP family putative glycoside hydrolase [Candidatus Sumerlaeia bacterium]
MKGAGKTTALGMTLLAWGICLCAAAETSAQPSRGQTAIIANAVPHIEIYSDPYRRYFSGHWCDCWRKANIWPIDEKAMFAGILPRTDTPMWMKHKVFDMRDMTADEKLLCRVTAGLVNRVKGMWYCQEDNDFWRQGTRQFFKDGIIGPALFGTWSDKRGGGGQHIGFTCPRTGPNNFMVGVKRFFDELDPPSIDGCILYDPALLDPSARPKQPRDMLNVIRTMCAIERAIPLTPRLHQDLKNLLGGRELPVIKDTTQWDEFNIDKFHGDEKAAAYALYAWAFNNFWNNPKNPKRQCTHHVLAYMPPLDPDDPDGDLTDYIVQWSVFTFYSYGGTNFDEKHMEYVLTQAPMNIPVLGRLTLKTGPEGAEEMVRVLRLFSRFGKYFIDAQQAGNLSMHSGARDKERAVLKQPPAPPVALDAAKHYVAFCLTGGNSVGHFMSARARHWDFASRGSVPLGWSVPLAAADVLPNIAKFYYQQAKPTDCFVADLGGLGMAYPTVWGKGSNQPEQLLTGYLQRAKEYLDYLALSTLWAAWLDPSSLEVLTKTIPGLQGVFYGTSGAHGRLERASFMADRLPVVFAYTDLIQSAAELEKLPATLAQAKERFIFVAIDERAFDADTDVVGMIAATARKLGDRFVVVRPDQLTALFSEAVKIGQVPAGPPKLAQNAALPSLPIRRVADGAIRVDGNPAEWTQAAAHRVYVTRDGKTVPESAKPADGDIAAEVATAIDSRFLYVLATVRDKEIIVDDVNLAAGDHLELSLDLRRDPFRDAEMTEGFYRLALVPAAGLVKNPALVLRYPTYDVGLASMNKHGVQQSLSSRATADGYQIEAAIPLVNFAGVDWKTVGEVAMAFAVRNLDSRAAGANAGALAAASAKH